MSAVYLQNRFEFQKAFTKSGKRIYYLKIAYKAIACHWDSIH